MDEAKVKQNKYRTHNNNQLSKSNVGDSVRLSGWVQTRRDHGGLIFIDLRDKWGITQLTFNPEKNKETFSVAEDLRSEYVVNIEGTVVERPAEMVNKNLDTGEIEVEVGSIEILNTSKTPPFEIGLDQEINEETRLTYRFLDLRNPRLQVLLKKRDQFIQHIRDYMHKQDFTEVQTPILANSSPEGARDYLVPSRLHPGKFYALPQAPQQFKQLLMVGGLDRYFQIAPCFRDEDSRADRATGDFYQIDLEMSFVEQEDVWEVVEPLMIELTETFTDKKIVEKPFPRIPWKEAMEKYGSDKPDLRFELFISDVTDIAKSTEFKVFNDAKTIHALHVEGGADFTRKDIEELTEVATTNGAKGLAYILIKDEPTSPIIKFLGEDALSKIIEVTGAKKGDAIFFGADKWEAALKALGAVRNTAAEKLKLKDDSKAAWVWVTDFPMYEYNEEEGRIDFSHNPFSMPQGGMQALEQEDPTQITGFQYDLALNGFEISSGAIRNHRPDIMYKAFEIAGYKKEEVDKRFGAMIKAFEYGAPPHGGFAPGLDRLFYLLMDLPNIRDIHAFPKDGKGRDLMMDSPSEVNEKQLNELHLELELED